MIFIDKHYGRHYAENTRETIRRQTLHQFEQAGLVTRNSDDPNRSTNSPNNVYELSDAALATLKSYGSTEWQSALATFLKIKGKLVERYEKGKESRRIIVNLSPEEVISLSPGPHNELQVEIVNKFRARFCPQAAVLYIGDTAIKLLHKNDGLLQKLEIDVTEHDKLPDVIMYDSTTNHLFLIEAVTAHGPISPKRRIELEEMLARSPAERIYVSAFPDFHEFKRHIDSIAWDTEVWIASNPDHMIHFNGEQFFNVYGG